MKTLITLFVLFLATSYCYPQSGWVLQNSSTTRNIFCIKCIDEQNCWALGNRNHDELPYNDSLIVLHTSNGGLIWEKQFNTLVGIYNNFSGFYSINFYDIDFYDKNNGCLGAEPYSYYTTNGGIKWTPIDTVFDSFIFNVKYVNNHTIWTYGNHKGRDILRSTDNGQTWNKSFSDSINIKKIFFFDTLNGWAIGDSSYNIALIHTSDGGKNWTVKIDTSINIWSASDFVFTDINTGWIFGDYMDGFFTTDGGISWSKKIIDSTYGAFLQIKFFDKKHGWILGGGGFLMGYPKLYKTINGGVDWIIDNNFPDDSLNAFEFTDTLNGWAVGKHGHIWHTTTGGVGVKDNRMNADNLNIAISPNPTQDIVSAKCNVPIPINTKIELYSYEGLLIKDLKVADFIGKQQFQFSVEELPTGIYFLKMSYSGGVHAYPVCIMK
ncbi:MAG: T9SS type A sorting domain-containing protein [FCB group bacterium]